MKFDVFKFQEIDPSQSYESVTGKVHVLCSKPTAVYATVEGYQVLLGVGTEIRAEIASKLIELAFEAPKGTRAFVYAPTKLTMVDDGEIYTNIDRKPQESGSVLEVRKALREFQLDQMGLRQSIRDERRALAEERARRQEIREERRERREAENPAPADPEPVEGEPDETPAS